MENCNSLCLRVVCVGKRKEVLKYFSKKTNTTYVCPKKKSGQTFFSETSSGK
uniref:Uncharacterized protein n=1 Tax=Helianthus annuus TaxID=4232 RepID=A0A251VSD6_HELAN